MITVSHVSKTFAGGKSGPVIALKDVSFIAEAGKVHALLGVNGAGKTTMMRIICTVIKPDHGSVEVMGDNALTSPDEVRKTIGFLSATGALYSRLTPKEIFAYFGQLYSLDKDFVAQRSAYLIERLGIGDFADRLCDGLSTGQKQRVSIARSVLHDPPVIVFDEPTSGLDVVSAQTVLEFVEESRDAGKTIIYSTHIMPEVERLADIITVIHEGVVKGQATHDELLVQTGGKNLEKAFLTLVGAFKPPVMAGP